MLNFLRKKGTEPVRGELTRIFIPLIPVKWFIRGAWILLVIAILFAGSYAIYFGLIKSYPPGAPESWGQFGDFFGGLLNPIVGFITIALLAITLLKVQEEIYRMTSMYEVDRLFRLCDKVYSDLEEVLDYQIRVGIEPGDRTLNKSGSAFSKLLKKDTAKKLLNVYATEFPDNLASKKELESAKHVSGASEWDFQLNGNFGKIFLLIDELNRYSSRIRSITNKTEVLDYYSNRLRPLLFAIAIKGYMTPQDLANFNMMQGLKVARGDGVEEWKVSKEWKMEKWKIVHTENGVEHRFVTADQTHLE